MSLLSSNQRAFIAVDTQIHPLIIDRTTEAFDALIERGDMSSYNTLMSTAIAQMGYDRPVRQEDRPTAVDVMKTILIKAYADREHISYRKSLVKIKRMMRS